ncbi:MAG TPA: ABC transporter permease [Streptosporangiaceae bacterium]|nr:ABC transporter permease [Streptosporangiaceae bacterium]
MTVITAPDAGTLVTPGKRGRRRPSLLIALSFLIVALVVICAFFGSQIAPFGANAQNLSLATQAPSAHHLLGTDDFGRDILSRLIVGARAAVIGPTLIAVGALIIGNSLGLIAGYVGGRVDYFIMRLADLVWALPGLLIAIVVVGVIGGGYYVAVTVLIVLTFPIDARIVRGAALQQRNMPYVEAAGTLGISPWRVMLRHIWPNLLPLVMANTFLNFAFSLVALSGLSFLGLGVPLNTPDWGGMLAQNFSLIQSNAMACLGPAIALVLTATSMNLIGDWIYERLSDRGRAR